MCLLMGLFAVWMGPNVMLNPATCDFEIMSANDLCQHGNRVTSERLIADGALHYRPGEFHNVEQQKSFNRVAGPLYLLGGLLFVVGSLFLGTLQIRALQTRREQRAGRRG